MALDTAPEPLPCGRDPLEVIDRSRRGRADAHTRTCEFCQAVIRTDSDAEQIRDTLRDQPIQPPETLLPAVMRTVWSELRPGRNIPLQATHGAAFATEQAITTLLSDELDRLPNFLVHTCRLHVQEEEAEGSTAARSEPLSPALRIEVTAAAAYAVDLNELGDSARAAVVAALWAQFELVAGSVDISFVDIYQYEGALQ